MTPASLKNLLFEHSVFAKNLKTGLVIMVIVHFDNSSFLDLRIVEINSIKRFLSEIHKLNDLGPYDLFICLKIERQIEAKPISLSKEIDVQKTLEHSGKSDCKPKNAPMVVDMKYIKNARKFTDEVFIWTYQSHVKTHILA